MFEVIASATGLGGQAVDLRHDPFLFGPQRGGEIGEAGKTPLLIIDTVVAEGILLEPRASNGSGTNNP